MLGLSESGNSVKGTFKKQLSEALRESDPKAVMKEAHKKYKEILAGVTEFEKGDRFLINILSCALLSSILLSVKNKYTLEGLCSIGRTKTKSGRAETDKPN